MGVRKNAKFLTASEREAFVRACVMMKADIVNPGGPDPSSRWDQYVAIHRFIQNVTTPATPNVNFGHGGTGARIPVVASLLPVSARTAIAELRGRRHVAVLGLDRPGRHDRG